VIDPLSENWMESTLDIIDGLHKSLRRKEINTKYGFHFEMECYQHLMEQILFSRMLISGLMRAILLES